MAALLAAGCPAEGEENTIGPRGGTLVSDDGELTVEVRPGALEEAIPAQIFRTDTCEGEYVACYAFEPWGVMLGAPATAVFEHDAAAVLQLRVEGADGWSPMPDPGFNDHEGTVWGTLMYLTSLEVSTVD